MQGADDQQDGAQGDQQVAELQQPVLVSPLDQLLRTEKVRVQQPRVNGKGKNKDQRE